MTATLAPVVGLLALFGLPLFAVFGALTLLYLAAKGQDVQLIVTNLYQRFTGADTLVTIPLFTFAGYLMAESRTGERLVRLFNAWFGWMPGGLAIVCLLACAFFTTFTGASGITIIAIGALLYPVLLKQAYPEKFSLGLITASGSLGLLFPPSLPIIVYGIISGADIQRLFVAGILPGILLILVLGFYSIFVAFRARVERQRFELREAGRALKGAFWEALLPVLILGLTYSGAVAVNETAVVAAAYVLVIECFVYRDISLTRDLPRVIREAMVLVGAIFIILAVAVSFTDALIFDEVPEKIFSFINQYVDNKWVFLLLLNVLLLIVGCLMDIFSAIIVIVPLIVPVAVGFGVDPTHLGIVFLANLEIGYMTPPVGINLFLASMRFNKPVVEMYRVALPYIALLLGALAIITYVPKLSLWLPEALGFEARAEKAERDVQAGVKKELGGKDDLDEDDDKPPKAPAAAPGDGGGKTKADDDEGDELGGDEAEDGAKPKAAPPRADGGSARMAPSEDDDELGEAPAKAPPPAAAPPAKPAAKPDGEDELE
jgi:C4-dicarboxylate transporter DctM subunit